VGATQASIQRIKVLLFLRVKRKPSVADYSPLLWRLRITGAIHPLFPLPASHAQGSVADYSPLLWRLRITGAIHPLFPLPASHAQGRLYCFQSTRLFLKVNLFVLTLRCWSNSSISLILAITLFSIHNEFKN